MKSCRILPTKLVLLGVLVLSCGEGSRDPADRRSGGAAGASSQGGSTGEGEAGAVSGAAVSGGAAGAAVGAGGSSGAGAVGEAGQSPVCYYGAGGAVESEVHVPWDWSGVVGTGQSLAVGDHGFPVRSTSQPYDNLQLSTGTLPWPIDPDDESLQMVPLTEPIGRRALGYPSSWPENIAGETLHSAMGNQVTALALGAANQNLVSVHGEFGENGQCMAYLKKDPTRDSNPDSVNGRAFEATVIATQAVTRLAEAEGKTYGIGAITLVHGECDAGSAGYEDALVQLWSDYNTELRAITGQAETIQMLVSQQNSTNDHSASTLAQWRVGVDHPENIACVGPTYQYQSPDGTHLVGEGYRQLGEKFGQVYFERVVLGRDWQPLQPTIVERDGRVITVRFHVPVPPLVWDSTLQAPHQGVDAWAKGKGFEVKSGATKLAIESARIVCDAVEITMADDLPATSVMVSYALYAETEPRAEPVSGMRRWGLLRDSDPFSGSTTQTPQPNYCVAFEMPVP